MDENRIRQIVQQELGRSSNGGRFGLNTIPFHTHDGINSQKIKEENIIPATSISGSITFAQETTYTLYLNSSFTPRSIFCTGNVTGGSQRYVFTGTAQLGASFFFQPESTTSVRPGGPQYPFTDPNFPEYGTNIPMQSCTYFGAESAGGALHTLVGNFHIVDIQFPIGTSHARATVTDFSRDKITIIVDALDSGWEINANFIVT